MSYAGVNLAARPFANRRPVVRVTILLWVVGGVLLLVNAALYQSHFVGQGDKRERLAGLERQVAGASRRIAEVEAQLEGVDLAWQNDQVAFLNRRIAERTFSWSRLFDRLAEVLPANVRLDRLNPEVVESESRSARRRGFDGSEGERVLLALSGAAKDDGLLLRFVDALFGHPAFDRPNLSSEAQRKGGELAFTMTVVYLPHVAPVPPAEAQSAPGAAGAAGEAGSAEEVAAVSNAGPAVSGQGAAPPGRGDGAAALTERLRRAGEVQAEAGGDPDEAAAREERR